MTLDPKQEVTLEHPPIIYSANDAGISKLRAGLTGLKADTPEGYEACRKGISVLRSLRVEIESRRVLLKADVLDYGRRVDGEAKRLTGLIMEIEEPLKAEKALIDDEKARIKKEQEDAERADEEEKIRFVREAEDAKLRVIREAEEARLKVEREELAKQAEIARVAQEKVDAENRRIAAEQKAEADRLKAEREKLERAAFEAEAVKRAEREAVEKLAREAAAKKAEQDAAEAEAKRVDAMRPDVEKIRALGLTFRNFEYPEVHSVEARRLIESVRAGVDGCAEECEDFDA